MTETHPDPDVVRKEMQRLDDTEELDRIDAPEPDEDDQEEREDE